MQASKSAMSFISVGGRLGADSALVSSGALSDARPCTIHCTGFYMYMKEFKDWKVRSNVFVSQTMVTFRRHAKHRSQRTLKRTNQQMI